ncbi:uncharacterized protein LOC132735691 [Ruditapes philippinarum]|uniref:uncharacterized protein LOC132735691 n=1 Tax=Ruditapes philippinarum TaxID=129788 RepID=UPI00295B84B1|nr:uncharacterized protein LOC132735691 [Ruditapes philippinarum]
MSEGGSEIQENDKVPGRVKEYLCQPCLKNEKHNVAENFCSTCNEFQCSDCSNVHNSFAISESHKLVNANEANTSRYFFDMKGLDKCDQHQEHYKFFCEDESKLCCSMCVFYNHRKCHSVVEVEKIARNRSQISTLMEKMKDALKDAEGIARQILTLKDQLAQNINEIPVKIKEMRDKVMRMFDYLEVFVVKSAEALQKETLVNLTKKQSLNEKHLAHVSWISDTIDNVYKNGTSAQKFIAEQNVENEVNVLCKHVKEECQNLETVTISFHFDKALKLPPRPITEHVPGQLISKSLRKGEINSVNMAVTLTPVYSILLNETAGDDIKKPIYFTGIDFLPDGRLIAVDNCKKCSVYNEKLEKVGSYQLSYQPLSVVAVSEEKVAITSDGTYVEFLHVSKYNEIRSSKKYKVTTKYNSIFLKDDRQLIVGTIEDQRPVRTVSLVGEEKNFINNFQNKAYPVGASLCTYIKNSDKLVLTDENTVYIYDIKTNKKLKVKDEQIRKPSGAAVGPSDTILVCSNRTNSIVQVSQTGQILSSHRINMDSPYRACVSRDKAFLVVTNNDNGSRKMQKFEIS